MKAVDLAVPFLAQLRLGAAAGHGVTLLRGITQSLGKVENIDVLKYPCCHREFCTIQGLSFCQQLLV